MRFYSFGKFLNMPLRIVEEEARESFGSLAKNSRDSLGIAENIVRVSIVVTTDDSTQPRF